MKTPKLAPLDEAVKRAWIEASRLLAIALVLLPIREANAASPEDGSSFGSTWNALASFLQAPSIGRTSSLIPSVRKATVSQC
jgi:hypothetical protein